MKGPTTQKYKTRKSSMQEFLQKLPAKAAEKRRENRQFFRKLKKRPPKALDAIARDLHEAEFQRTDCLDCANCCKTTGPLFTSQDIARISGHLKMKPGQFAQQYLRRDEDGDDVLRALPCPFLMADNRCLIYDVRPKACREYPHTDRKKIHQIGPLTIKNTAVCPAAFRIVEAMKARLPEYL